MALKGRCLGLRSVFAAVWEVGAHTRKTFSGKTLLNTKKWLPASRTNIGCFSTNHRQHMAANERHILKSPYADIPLPDSPFLPHYIMKDWNRFGDKLAMVNADTGEEATYNQLKDRITKVGSALVRMGFTKGDVLTILSPNCIEFAVMYLAAMSIGMTISSVNPLYTVDELASTLQLSGSSLIVSHAMLAPVVNEALKKCPNVKKKISFGPAEGFQPYSTLVDDDGTLFPENIDYDSHNDVIALPFSSGTTGLPKGVMITSYGTAANIDQINQPNLVPANQDDNFFCILPMFHAFGQFAVLLGGLNAGAKVVSLGKMEPEKYFSTIEKHKISMLHIVPPIVLLMARHPLFASYDMSSLTRLLIAAAPQPAEVLVELKERIGRDGVFYKQGYGMTESGPAVSICPCDVFRPESSGVVVPNTEMKIASLETGETLSPNEEGEICFRGPQMMKGYWKNEEATSKTLVDGWLHSGDVGYYDNEGHIIITDRVKELIKYKAMQVAPAELEALLLTHPAILDAAVVGKPDDVAGELPRAYVRLRPGHDVKAEEVQQFISERAAPHKKLRGGVEFIDEIPKTATGKILRRVLKSKLLEEL